MGALCCPCLKTSTVHCATQTGDVFPIAVDNPVRKSRVRNSFIQHEIDYEASFTNVTINTTDPLQLIDGYENESLVSLKDALAPVSDQITNLQRYIKEAQVKCYFPPSPKLTFDESAAVYIYTMKWSDRCVYDCLQDAWESEDPSKLKPWFRYLKLFKNAYDKLSDTTVEVWQGQSLNKNIHMIEVLRSKTAQLYTGMGPCSPSQDDGSESLNDHGQKKKLLVGLYCVGGKSTALYGVRNSSEVIIWPGMKIVVSGRYPPDPDGSLIFHVTGVPDGKYFDRFRTLRISFYSVIALPYPYPYSEPVGKLKRTDLHFVCRNYRYCYSISM